MTEQGYYREIKRKCDSLGVWREEFARTAKRLSRIYTRIDTVESEYSDSGGEAVVEYTNKAGATNMVRNPYLTQLDILYDQALTYEKELGLTAAALKRINEEALKPQKKASGLEAALRLLEGGG